MRRISMAALLVMLSACSDTSGSVLAPDASAKKGVGFFTTDDFRLWGFTSGPGGTIISEGGGEWNVCSRSSVIAPATGQIIWVENECRTYAVPVPGGGGETYEGGQMTATIIQNGQAEFLAAANANVNQRAKIVSPPTDATVEIVAEAYENCSFTRWELQAFNGTTTVSWNPTVIHTAARGGTTYRAFFSCTA
jgi:hypothetical protein